jgi:hypothetical protein
MKRDTAWPERYSKMKNVRVGEPPFVWLQEGLSKHYKFDSGVEDQTTQRDDFIEGQEIEVGEIESPFITPLPSDGEEEEPQPKVRRERITFTRDHPKRPQSVKLQVPSLI